MQFVNQLLQLLQSGISAIFGFVRTAWVWSIGQMQSFSNLPWGTMPAWKLILAGIMGAAAVALFYLAAKSLWEHLESLLKAFASLLGAFVEALPYVIGSGIVIAVLMWVVRTF